MNIKAAIVSACGVLLLSTEKSDALYVDILDMSPASFSVKCNSCVGILDDGSLDPNNSFGTNIGSANEANIAAYLTSIGFSGTTTTDVTKFDLGTGGLGGSGSSTNYSFDVGSGVFFVKYGTNTAFFQSSGPDTITFVKSGGGAGALSNYGTVGPVAPVPLPATILLLVGAVAALGVVRLRRSRTA